VAPLASNNRDPFPTGMMTRSLHGIGPSSYQRTRAFYPRSTCRRNGCPEQDYPGYEVIVGILIILYFRIPPLFAKSFSK
jgi:hypothetical protein